MFKYQVNSASCLSLIVVTSLFYEILGRNLIQLKETRTYHES